MYPSSIPNNPDIRNRLTEMIRQDDITAAVAHEALEYEDIPAFFRDLARHGCLCGMIPSFIYYGDTHVFYDHYYDEIEELRQAWEDAT